MKRLMFKLLRITTVPISLDLLLTNQMRYMNNKGIDVLMVSGDGPEIPDLIEREKCKHAVIPFTRRMTPLMDLWCLIKLVWLMIKEKPDIVHTHTPKAGLIGMLAAKLVGVRVRLHTVAGLPYMTAEGFQRTILKNVEKMTIWAATTVLPNSLSVMRFMNNMGLGDKKKFQVLGHGSTNGIDLNRFS